MRQTDALRKHAGNKREEEMERESGGKWERWKERDVKEKYGNKLISLCSEQTMQSRIRL